jgi:hypothetical protein
MVKREMGCHLGEKWRVSCFLYFCLVTIIVFLIFSILSLLSLSLYLLVARVFGGREEVMNFM